MLRCLPACIIIFATAVAQAQSPGPLAPAAPAPVRGAHYPSLSPDGKTLAFSYQGDLWTVPAEGGAATRLTVHPAYDAWPHWSPDGRWIAFSSNREGNYDIFLIPVHGGAARQVTYHSASDHVLDWSPDGAQLLFMAARDQDETDLYTLSLKDGRLRRVTHDRTHSRYGVFSPDGKSVAYARGGQAWSRTKYIGSNDTDLYLIPATGGKTTRLTDNDGWDNHPLFAPDGKTLYFASHRDGATNLWRMTLPGGKPEPVTRHTGDPVRFPAISRDGSRIVYEQGFQVWTLPLKAESKVESRNAQGNSALQSSPVRIVAAGDLPANQTRRLTLTSGAASLAVSSDGKRLAFAARGEVWTVPAEGGDATRLTKTGAAEYSPVWSPDDKTLAYTTDRNGSLDVFVMDAKTKVETPVAIDPADETDPAYSPDGRFMAWTRGGTEPGLCVLPLSPNAPPDPKAAVLIAPGPGISSYDWSPDGKWLVYAKRDSTATTDLWIIPSVGGTPVNVTRYPGMNSRPKWTRDGRHILFVSSRGGAPGALTANLYALRLVPEPEGDDRPTSTSPALNPPPSTLNSEDPEAQRRRMPPPQTGSAPTGPPPTLPPVPIPPRAQNVVIEFDDIQNRARALTSTREGVGSFAVSPDARSVLFAMTSGGASDWWVTDLVSGSTVRLTTGGETGGDVEFAPDASRFYFRGANGALRQMPRGAPAPLPVAFSAPLEVDRRVETTEAFNEAWRNLRTSFYDPKMHGVDWGALRAKYESLLPETATKEDFAWLLSAMIGELNASHTGASPASEPGPSVTTGYPGLDFDPDYAGPGLKVTRRLWKGPADKTGRRIEPGEYVMAMDGKDVAWGEDLYKTLRDTAGRTMELLVNSTPTKEGGRTVKIKPVTKAQADDLAYAEWVESRRRKVDALSGGTLGYHHIRAMDRASLERFQRDIYGDLQAKKGLVLDVRDNGGGRIHDDLLGILTRRPHVYEIPRDGERATQPFQLWNRPTVLLINERSASDAEIFPNGFREYGLGKIVGVPTYGGVIGTVNITLVDGTSFRVPRTGWYTLEGRNLENWGVPPDVRVENSPDDNAADNDRQLEAAVKLLLEPTAGK